MIRAFIFDFGNVICKFDPMIFLKRAQPYSSLSIPELVTALRGSVGTVVEYETGLLTSDEFLARVSSALKLSISKEQFINAYAYIFEPIGSTHDLIRRLKPHYKLGLLSNTSEWHFEYGIRHIEVFPLFDTVTLSYVVKAMKPAKEIYFDALAKLRVKPEECVYIDDLEENVEGARAVGMHGIHFTGGDALLEALQPMGIVL